MSRSGLLLRCWALLVLAACSGRDRPPEGPRAAVPHRPVADAQADTAQPAVPEETMSPVPVPLAFRAAIAAGTRTLTGRPGAGYWRQHVEYQIDAELDPELALVRGEEVVTFRNQAPDTLPYIALHLYQNLFRAGAPRTEPVPRTGGVTLERVVVDGERLPPDTLGTGRGYSVDGTRMRVPVRVAPGARVELEIDWRFSVPPAGAPRMGHEGTELFEIAQWYPQVAVYDDLHGWDDGRYRGRGEFYLEYGDFDVTITAPEGYLIAATGTLRNPDEVLSGVVLDRLGSAAGADSVVHVVTEADLGGGAATQRVPGGTLSWRFEARDVRDFAFAASDRYLWDATTARTPDADGDGTPERVAIHAFYRPEAEAWRTAAEVTRRSVEDHARLWHPYIYPQMTAVEGPEGGMEYPMLTFVGGFPFPPLVREVINHEVAHMWWPMLVGADEAAHAWMDEGLATYAEHETLLEPGARRAPLRRERRGYLSVAASPNEEPMTEHADRFASDAGYAVAAYYKPAVALRALEALIGRETVRRALAEYTDRWLLKHPAPLDFFNTVEDVAAVELDWFWHRWWYTTDVLDQAIVAVEIEPDDGGEAVSVVIENQGGIPMPAEVGVVLTTGEMVRVSVPVEAWLEDDDGRETVTVRVPEPVARIVLDPDGTLPDVDPSDNRWSPPEPSPPGG